VIAAAALAGSKVLSDGAIIFHEGDDCINACLPRRDRVPIARASLSRRQIHGLVVGIECEPVFARNEDALLNEDLRAQPVKDPRTLRTAGVRLVSPSEQRHRAVTARQNPAQGSGPAALVVGCHQQQGPRSNDSLKGPTLIAPRELSLGSKRIEKEAAI
jgi:hypothetical protein